MFKVLIPQDISEPGKAYLKEKGYDVIVGSGYDKKTIKKEIVDCDAVIARTAIYTADVIAEGKKLKIIARYGVGTDNIDVKAAEKRGVYVTITKNVSVHSVAEHTMALLLAGVKNLVYCDVECKSGNWEIRNKLPGVELFGKTVGIIGVGAIGTAFAKKVHYGLEMNVIGYDPYVDASKLPDFVKLVSLQELCRRSDAISLHVPATEETHGMINREVFNIMKNNSILINCARGGIVVESDLCEALITNKIAGAAMDVFANEPASVDNELFLLPNFTASPHSAGMSTEARDGMGISCAMAIDDVLNGLKPKYPVNNPIF